MKHQGFAKFLTLLLLGAGSLAAPPARAAPPCLNTDNKCEPDKLCTFEQQLSERIEIRRIYLDAAARKSVGGRLYQESIAEASQHSPHASPDELAVIAGQIFQEKVPGAAKDVVKIPECKTGTLAATFAPKFLPRPGYEGMFTNASCQVRVNFEAGDYDPEGFGATDPTSCPEFYDRDRAHEAFHKALCDKAKKAGDTKYLSIDRIIRDEIKAYDLSVRLDGAYVRLLSLLCSSTATPELRRNAAERYQRILAPYLSKGK
ncbi:MAG: hypothetical protein U1E65_11645 [Myxococcota bacterium]